MVRVFENGVLRKILVFVPKRNKSSRELEQIA
jgi:hypothetical protein